MYMIHGYTTQNNKKTYYIAQELGLDWQFKFVNLQAGENYQTDFKKMNPVRKTPVLEHDGKYLFESAAICRYLANQIETPLYPQDKYERAVVDQWMCFMSSHLGHWLNVLYFNLVLKENFNLGGPNMEEVQEASKFASKQFKIINEHFEDKDYFCGEHITIADHFAYAYIEQIHDIGVEMDEYPNVVRWMKLMDERPAIVQVKELLKDYM